MIPYADLERALARWKAKARAGTPDGAGAAESDSDGAVEESDVPPHETNGVLKRVELSGEIDINELEGYEE